MEINTLSLYNLNSADVVFQVCDETVKIKTPEHEEGFGFIVKNIDPAEAEIIIKSGNSVMAMGDVTVTIPGEGCALVNLKDTGRFKNVHGEDAGYIVLSINPAYAPNLEMFAFAL